MSTSSPRSEGHLLRLLLSLCLLALISCGTPPPSKESSGGQFTLTSPPGVVEVLHGGQTPVPVDLTWQREPHEEVELSVTVEPAGGVSARVVPDRLPAGNGTVQVTILAVETARAGEYTTTVTGKAARAGTVRTTIRVKVPAKE